MADNIDITPGTGKTVATDDVGGFHYQKIKQSFGPDDAAQFGSTPFFDSSVDNSSQAMKTTPGLLFFLEVQNSNTSDVYLQIFDTASPTVGTTAPKLSLLVPAGNGTLLGVMEKVWRVPMVFADSIRYAATTTATGSGNPSSALVLNGGYI